MFVQNVILPNNRTVFWNKNIMIYFTFNIEI